MFSQGEDEFINLVSGLIFENNLLLHNYLLNLICLSQFDEIEQFKIIIKEKKNILPEELYVPDKFCLNQKTINYIEQVNKIKVSESMTNHLLRIKPYKNSIELLRTLNLYTKPLDKLFLINKLSRSISDSINEFWTKVVTYNKKNDLGIDADNLLSIFTYIVLKSNIENIIEQIKFIEYLTSDKTRTSMIGYYHNMMEVSLANIQKLGSEQKQ